MDRIGSSLAIACLAVLAFLTVGCEGNSTAAPGTDPDSVSAASPSLPSPFTITARYSAKALGLNHPVGLAVGPDGDVYVTDLSQRVTELSPAGKVLRRWGKLGSGRGEFHFATPDLTEPDYVLAGIAVGPDGKVYVSDSGNARVQVFTADGRFIREFGGFGSGKGQLLRPYTLKVDNANNVYVDDDVALTVNKYSPGGRLVWQIGGFTASDPDLAGHLEITGIDSHGRLVVVNDDRTRILYIDASGHEVDAFSPSTSGATARHVCEATVDAMGNTYVSGCGCLPGCPPTGPTLVYDMAHRLIAKWPGTRTYSLLRSPVFGPHGEIFALATDGSILKLRITLPEA